MEKKTPLVVLQKFFGYKVGQTMKEFAEEIKALSPAEKLELATLAAAELGIELEQPAAKL